MFFNYEVSSDDLQNFSRELWADKNKKKLFLKMYLKSQIKLYLGGTIFITFIITAILKLIGMGTTGIGMLIMAIQYKLTGISENFLFSWAVLFFIIFVLISLIIFLDYILVLTPKRLASYINHNCIDNKKITKSYKKNQSIKYIFETEDDSFANQEIFLSCIKKRILIKNDKYCFSCPYDSVIDIYETDNYYAFIINFSTTPFTFIIPKRYIQTAISSEFNEIISKIKNNACNNKKDVLQYYDLSRAKKGLGIVMNQAIIITDIMQDSNARELGLEKGDIILEINGKNIISNPISNYECANEIKRSKHIKIKVKNIITNEIKTIETDIQKQ